MQNDMARELPVRIQLGGQVISAALPADSVNTIVI
ncbi:MAG TPA: hypothetical protein VIT67_13970 [Povalibacter sp.]